MISIFKQLYNQHFSIPQYNLLILGLQQTGKTRLFSLIKYIDNLEDKLINKPYQPTVGFNTTKYRSKQAKFTVWDLGGKKALRKIWQNYYSECHCLIFMFDQRIKQGLNALWIISHNQMVKIPVLILVQNQSQKNQISALIQKNSDQFARQYIIQVFMFEKMGALSIKDNYIKKQKLRIDQILKWIYSKTYKLDLQVRNY